MGVAERNEFQSRYQDYRALVEGLRVQKYWHQAQLRETVADHYMRQHRSELDWIRNAIRVCRVLDDTAKAKAVTSETERRCIIGHVRDSWIERQIAYLSRRRGVERRAQRTFRAIALTLLSVSVVLVVFAFMSLNAALARFAAFVGAPDTNSWRVVIVVIAVTAVLSGLAESFSDKRAFRVHAKQYRRMQGHFERARMMLDDLLAKTSFAQNEYDEAQSVIRDLGVETLAENGAWVMLHRERPVEFVHGS